MNFPFSSLAWNICINDAKEQLNMIADSFDSLKVLSRSSLSISTVTIAFATAMNWLVLIPTSGLHFYLCLIASFVYLALLFTSVVSQLPYSVVYPLKAGWDNYINTFIKLDEEEVNQKYLSSLINAIELNIPSLQKRRKITFISVILSALFLVLIIIIGITSINMGK